MRSTSGPQPTPGCRRSRSGSPRPTGPTGPSCGSSWPTSASTLRAEKLSEVAAEFDSVHDIHRAVEVGSVDAVIEAADIRPRIIAAIDRDLLEDG